VRKRAFWHFSRRLLDRVLLKAGLVLEGCDSLFLCGCKLKPSVDRQVPRGKAGRTTRILGIRVQIYAKLLPSWLGFEETGPSQVAGPYYVANEAKPDSLGLDEGRNDEDNGTEYTRASLRQYAIHMK